MKTFLQYTKEDETQPQISDWVIDVSDEYGEIINILCLVDHEWLSVNDIKSDYTIKVSKKLYTIKYDTNFNKKDQYNAWLSEIKFIGTKKEVEIKIETDKYNL